MASKFGTFLGGEIDSMRALPRHQLRKLSFLSAPVHLLGTLAAAEIVMAVARIDCPLTLDWHTWRPRFPCG